MLGLMLFGMPLLAFAEDIGLSKQYSTCMDKAGGITANMLDCIGAETQRQDARLNRAYKDVMAQLSAARKKQLQEAQRAWIRYRRLSDLGIVGCKLSAAAHFSPSFCPIARLLGCKSGKNCARWGQFSLSTPQVRQPPRDANCGFYADPDGGTLATVNGNDCFMSATAARAKALEGFKQ